MESGDTGPWSDWLVAHEPVTRLVAFAGVLLLMATWEVVAPRRELVLPKGRRWLANLSLAAVNTLLLRFAFPAAALGAAAVAANRGWGLLHALELPLPLAVAVSVLLLDLAVYVQHVLFHALPTLWRLHRVHHADLDLDVSTGLRFHPLEILASMGIKLACVVLIGAPAVGVLLFEVALNATSMFNHGNVRIPVAVDQVLRWVVVTPDMHRVHHSTAASETNRNFGFSLPWWDRLFGTYRPQPAAGHVEMTLGLERLQERAQQGLVWMLRLPFRRK